jgi:hypothetical protein
VASAGKLLGLACEGNAQLSVCVLRYKRLKKLLKAQKKAMHMAHAAAASPEQQAAALGAAAAGSITTDTTDSTITTLPAVGACKRDSVSCERDHDRGAPAQVQPGAAEHAEFLATLNEDLARFSAYFSELLTVWTYNGMRHFSC